jgi:hypothetical protein
MSTDAEILKDIEYIDEDLEDIEYTEILTFEEMSKINPSFIALDKEEIYNHLYIFFKNKKKSDLMRSLFYEILINRDSKNGKINDYTNYIFDTETELVKYGDNELDNKTQLEIFIDKYKDKSQFKEFYKRKFSAVYNINSDKIRLKPTHNTNIIISENNEFDKPDFPKYYPIIKEYPIIKCSQIDKVEYISNINDGDDINLPVNGAYYKIPTSTNNDYMYTKIASHLLNSINTNYKSSDNYKDIYELIKDTRPYFGIIIDEINNNKDSYYLDYSNINNIFKKYDYSLDFISEKDLEILSDNMYSIIKNEKERKSIHKSFKIIKPKLINQKLTFFDNIDKTLKYINVSSEIVSFLEKTRELINNYKNDILQDNVEPLKNYNIYDIIQRINDDTIKIEDVIEDLKLSIKYINLDITLETINDILEAKENIEGIKDSHNNNKNLFKYTRDHTFDYDTDGKHYVISKRENKAICDGNDIDDYEGLQDDDDIIDDENKGVVNDNNQNTNNNNTNNYDLNAYISNINFRNDKGFIEILKIILNMIKKINDIANIDIDYDEISSFLFKKYRGESTRYEKYLKEFETNNKDDAIKNAKKYSEMFPNHIRSLLSDKKYDKINRDIIKNINEKFIKTINEMFYNSICFWIVDTQDKIFKNKVSLNINNMNPNHIDKLNTRGLLFYTVDIISEYFKNHNNNEYMINTEDLRRTLKHIIENEYKNIGDDILNELLYQKINEKKNKCNEDKYKNLDDERYYIHKLLFTPNNNTKYEKIHKYIQGCCLRKLDNNFNDISDFENTNNSEIIKLKEHYSKVRINNIKRDIRFTPPKVIKKSSKKGKKSDKSDDEITREDEENDDDKDIYMKEDKEKYKNIKFINKKQYTYNINNNDVAEWLESMRNVSELLPNNLIDSLKMDDFDSVRATITDNIKKLKKVKKNINMEFLNCKYINYKEILLNICKILYVNFNSSPKYKDNEKLKEKIFDAIKEIKTMLKHLYKLNKIRLGNNDDDNENGDDIDSDIYLINLLIISNSLNYPELSGIENIPSDFISYNTGELYEYIKNYVDGKYNKFLTSEEIAIFINEKREEYKIKKLKEFDGHDQEENEIRRQVKAAGLIKDIYDGEDDEGGTKEGDVKIDDDYKDDEKDDDYNYKDNDNYNTYNDDDKDID